MLSASPSPVTTHTSSFGFVSLMILCADSIRISGWSFPRSAGLGLGCGMMVAVRFQNFVWLAVPVVLLLPGLGGAVVRGRPGWGRFVPGKISEVE